MYSMYIIIYIAAEIYDVLSGDVFNYYLQSDVKKIRSEVKVRLTN